MDAESGVSGHGEPHTASASTTVAPSHAAEPHHFHAVTMTNIAGVPMVVDATVGEQIYTAAVEAASRRASAVSEAAISPAAPAPTPASPAGAAATTMPEAAPGAAAAAAAPPRGCCGRRRAAGAAGAAGGRGRGRRGGKEVAEKVSFRQLFRFASRGDICLLVVASIAAAINGFIFPGFALLFGELLNAFNDLSAPNFVDSIERFALWFLLISIGAGVCSFLESALAIVTSERQVRRVREAYLRALLRQPVSYYDVNKGGEMAAGLVEDTITLMNGLSDKISSTFKYSVTFFGGLAVGFARSWQRE